MVAKKWTLKQIARAVKVSPRTVAEQLARLALQTRGRKTPYPVVERPDGRKQRHRNTERLRELHRGKFLAIREGNPQLSRNKIAQKYGATYSWLYQNDQPWLLAHLPAKVCPSDRPPRQSKWLSKDAELAAAVVVEAARIRGLDGRPEMISETAIASNLEILHVWSKRRRVLPLTTKALHSFAETWEEFAVRRVEWAAANFAEQGLSPSRWRIVARAGLTSKVAKTPVIAAALDRAAAFLISQMELDYSDAA
jgi:hypothetical protein